MELEQQASDGELPQEIMENSIRLNHKDNKEVEALELKTLPPSMKYAYLGDNNTYPVLINSSLSEEQEEELSQVLRQHRDAIGWTLADLKEISSSMCMHKILLEEGAKPSRQQQRRLNPTMNEVVQKEVMKLWQAGVIYPISDSPWEKCHFMVTEGVVLGHKISKRGIDVDKAKVEVIAKLPPPCNVKTVRSFLGHAGFYRRFIRDFSKVSKPLTNLLVSNVLFVFDKECMLAFEELKNKLSSAPFIAPPSWDLPFELMRDASDFAVGAVLG
ncbi:uncharacterized protein [Arachis hypogaea]|uniref:uncharacterized protein n=1 Tax=Arachis hypogaea TaxID=3818 RepID=UPI003B2207AB